MSKMALISAGVLCVLVLGCTHVSDARRHSGDWRKPPPEAENAPRCGVKEKECRIAVDVRGCEVTVEPDWIRVSRRKDGVDMVWEIRRSDGATFALNAIVWKSRQGQRVFTIGDRPDNKGKTEYRVRNSTEPGVYYYGVQVVDRNGRHCPIHDPGVVNDM